MFIIKVILFFFLFWLTTPSAFCEIGETDPHFPRIANVYGAGLKYLSLDESISYWKNIRLFIGGSLNFHYDWECPDVKATWDSNLTLIQKNVEGIKSVNPNTLVLSYSIPTYGDSDAVIPSEWWLLDSNGDKIGDPWGDYQINIEVPEVLPYVLDASKVMMSKSFFDGIFYDSWWIDDWLVPETFKLHDGKAIVMVNHWNLPNSNFDKANGALAEDEINRVIDGEVDFENFLNRYIRWTTESIKPTVTTIVCHPKGVITEPSVLASMTDEERQIEFDRAYTTDDQQIMRFGLTTALMGDGYFAYDYGCWRGAWWWYKEYDAPLGYPKGVAYKNSNGTWQRDYEGGTVIVNGTNYDTIINFSSPHTDVSTEEISQIFTLPSFDGRIFTFTQSSGCTYSIDPTNANYSSSGGTGSVNVTTSNNQCSWTATSNESWITITSGDSGTGNGTVSFSVMANTIQSSRTGTMNIAGETFTVIQEGVQQAECSTWTEVINKITAYVSGQADWSDVITCYTLYAVSQ